MNNTFFSIIIPTFNSGKTLENCLKSILNQTYTDFEVLMMDGVSTDDTLQIASSFNDDRIRVYSEPDKGIYDAMNKGIDLAKGEWLYFLGSDDKLFNNMVLEKVISFIRSTKSEVIYGNVVIDGDAGWAKDKDLYDGEFNLEKLLEKNICHQALFYHKSLLQNNRFKINYTICADYALNLELFAKFKFEFINLIISRFYGGGFSLKNKDLNFDRNKVIIKHYFYTLHKSCFFQFRNNIRLEAIKSKNLFKKLFLNMIYLKHKYIGSEN